VASFHSSRLFGGSLGLYLGYSSSHSKQAPFPFVRAVTTDIVAAAGDKLWKEFFGTSDLVHQDVNVTHLSLTFGGIETGEANQRGIEGFLTQSSDTSPRKGLVKRKVEDNDDVDRADQRHSSTSNDDGTKENAGLFLCSRCGKQIMLPESLAGPDIEDDVKQQALDILKTEHEDYHFAQELSQLPDDKHSGSPQVPAKAKKKQKKKFEVEGIARFFSKQ
jgi:DNA polymerase eta